MAQGRPRRAWCVICGRHKSECGPLSARGKCADCGDARMVENNRQLARLDGPFAEHWLERCRRAFGVVSVGDGGDETV